MSSVQAMREEVKKYIDKADDKVVKMVYAMLEEDATDDWWDTMPHEIKNDVQAALREADDGQLIPHDEIQKRFNQWLAK